MKKPPHYPRYLLSALQRTLRVAPVTLIHGPRQCGKTTLARWFEQAGYAYISFDDETQLSAARSDPKGYVAELPRRVILDEVQRVPGIFRSIKLSVDNDRAPGRFIMTGSANVLLVPKLGDSLAGRMSVLNLYPLSQAELAGSPLAGKPGGDKQGAASFFNALLKGKLKGQMRGRHLGRELAARVAAGGYPAARAAAGHKQDRDWYRQYARTQIQRDVRDLSRIHALKNLPRLLKFAAGYTAQLVNYSGMAAGLKSSPQTIAHYFTLLENIFLIDILPPWHATWEKRLIKTPKLHIGDTGLACALLDLDADKLWKKREVLGHLLETFVYQEIRKQASWQKEAATFSHFRDKNNSFEVDIVLECGGKIYGVEVKLSASFNPEDFKGLKKLRALAGEDFGGGVLLYDGDSVLPHGAKLKAVPISLLWEAPKP